MSIYGIHIDSSPSSLIDQIEYYSKLGCKVLQLFVTLNKNATSFYKPIKKLCIKLNLKISVHISYTINIANDPNKYSWGIQQFIEEIKIAHHIGAYAVVVHLGKKLDLSLEVALNNMFINLLTVHNQTKDLDIKILLETSTGQGSELCYNLDDLAKFYNKINKINLNKFGICLDTCHIFNAGYDIRSIKNINNYFKDFNDKIGLTEIKLIHLNDSYNDLGSKIDRHSNIDHGFIGFNSLKQIILLFNKLSVPIVLETPDDFINDDLNKLKQLSLNH